MKGGEIDGNSIDYCNPDPLVIKNEVEDHSFESDLLHGEKGVQTPR